MSLLPQNHGRSVSEWFQAFGGSRSGSKVLYKVIGVFKVKGGYSLGIYGPRTTPWEFMAVNPMVYGSKLLCTSNL